jgi:serine/threonine protein kinase
MQPIG